MMMTSMKQKILELNDRVNEKKKSCFNNIDIYFNLLLTRQVLILCVGGACVTMIEQNVAFHDNAYTHAHTHAIHVMWRLLAMILSALVAVTCTHATYILTLCTPSYTSMRLRIPHRMLLWWYTWPSRV